MNQPDYTTTERDLDPVLLLVGALIFAIGLSVACLALNSAQAPDKAPDAPEAILGTNRP